MKGIAGIHLRHLLRLAHTYGQTAFLAAATKVHPPLPCQTFVVSHVAIVIAKLSKMSPEYQIK